LHLIKNLRLQRYYSFPITRKNLSFLVIFSANATPPTEGLARFLPSSGVFFGAEQGQTCLLLPIKYFVVV